MTQNSILKQYINGQWVNSGNQPTIINGES